MSAGPVVLLRVSCSRCLSQRLKTVQMSLLLEKKHKKTDGRVQTDHLETVILGERMLRVF